MMEIVRKAKVVAASPRHVNLGTGVVQQVRGAQAKVEFPRRWRGQPTDAPSPRLIRSRLFKGGDFSRLYM